MQVTFTGTLGTEWTDVVIDENSGAIVWTNFTDNSVPGASDDVIIATSGVTISNSIFDHYSAQTGPVATFNLNITSAGSLTADDSQMTIYGSVENDGSFTILTDQVKVLGGIVNNYLMTINGASSAAYLLLDDGEFTLAGTGDLRLTSNTDGTAYLTGRDGLITDLQNEGRISGTGYIGWSTQQYYPGGYVTITNSGTIDADISGRRLIIAQGTTDANPLDNTGSLVANSGGQLIIDNAFVEQSGDGTIGAYGTGSKVVLNNVSLKGGLLDTTSGGTIYLETAGGYGGAGGGPGYTILDGSTAYGAVTITEDSLVRLGEAGGNGTDAQIKGAIVNAGEIGLLGYWTTVRVDSSSTLTGGGDIHLSYTAGAGGGIGGAMLQGFSDSVVSTLNNTDNHIHGAGHIGRYNYGSYADKLLSVVNGSAGVIEADNAAAPLVINRTVSFTNQGLLRASNGAELSIGGNIGNLSDMTAIDNQGGRIVASGSGSDVIIRGATVRGGTLDTDDDGVISLINSTYSVLDGSTGQGALTNQGTIRVDNGLFRGAIVNKGAIGFDPQSAARLYIATDGVTLSGTGTLTLAESSMILGESSSTNATLTNSGTIVGAGYIGTTPNGASGLLTFSNLSGGVVRSTTAGKTMTLDTSGTVRNAGLLEASGGSLQLGHNTGNPSDVIAIDNKDGRIVATGAGAEVMLKGSTVRGGTLDTASGGLIRLDNGSLSVLDGTTSQGAVTSNGSLRIDGGMFRGAVVNNGSVSFNPSNSATLYIAKEGVTLSGSGTMTLGGSTMIRGESSSATSAFVNAGTIAGAGYIGTTPSGSGSELLTLDNRVGGVIRASTGKTMVIDTSGTIKNAGLLEAKGGTLQINDLITGTGTIRVSGGGTLLINGGMGGTVTFSGTTQETLGHSAGSVWAGGKTTNVKGFGLGDRIDLAYESGYLITAPDTFTWVQSGENGTFRFSVGGETRSFVFEGLSQLHVTLVDNGAGGLAIKRVATIDGTSGNNTLSGTAGDDRIVGFAGDDIFRGSAGKDRMDGGTGLDTIDYSQATGAVRVSLATTAFQAIGGGQGSDSLRYIENATGSGFNDTITGNSTANLLKGGAGNDLLDGGTGVDRLEGGAGNDTFIVDTTGDVVVELSNQGTDTVRAGATYTLSSNVENLTLTGTGSFNGTGNTLANVLIGNSGKNTLKGDAGNDTLDGGAGVDRLEGGAGNDTFIVDTTGDVVVELSNQGTDTVRAGATYTLSSNVENLTLTGTGSFNGTGNTLANVLIGNSGKNTLKGGAGDDTITGGSGADQLHGGSGRDIFMFLAPGDSSPAAFDKIFDFSIAEKDKINLKSMDANLTANGKQSFTFIGDSAFHKKAGELRFEKKSGDTLIHGDVTGDGKADFTIVLDPVLTLRVGDFIL